MADWARKHMNDLIYAVRWHHRDDSIPCGHRQRLQKVIELGQPLKSGPGRESSEHGVMEVVAVLCDVCKDIGRYRCEGRPSWQLPCALDRRQQALNPAFGVRRRR